MLRLLSIRNFVVVEALDLELARGFTVLAGETGAGKSILLDALGLLLGDRFELRRVARRPGPARGRPAARAPRAGGGRPQPRVGQRPSRHAGATRRARRAPRGY